MAAEATRAEPGARPAPVMRRTLVIMAAPPARAASSRPGPGGGAAKPAGSMPVRADGQRLRPEAALKSLRGPPLALIGA